MARYKEIEEGQGYFMEIYPEDQFSDYSIEKVINRFVDEEIDITPFSMKYRNDETGQKAIHPKIKLKVLFYSWVNGIKHSREIEAMMRQKHLGYVYLSGNIIIDHSTVCEFIDEFNEEIIGIFSKLLMLMNEMGLIDWTKIMIDGTKIESNASKVMTDDLKGFKKKLERYSKMSRRLIERARYLDRKEQEGEIDARERERESERIRRQEKVYSSIIGKIEEYNKEVEKGLKDSKEKVNLTDGESSMLKSEGGYIQGYNVQAAYSANDIIVDVEAVSSPADQRLIEERVKRVEAIKKENSVEQKSKYIADKGYYNPDQLVPLLGNGKEVYVATPKSMEKTYETLNRIERDSEHIYYRCVNGVKVKGYYSKNKDAYRFDIKKKECAVCSLKSECWAGLKEGSIHKRFEVTRTYADNKELWIKYKQKMEQEEGRWLYNKRLGKEHNFHDLKKFESGGRLLRRGRDKCNCEIVLSAIAHNLKKLQKYLIEQQGKSKLKECYT